MQSTSSSIWHRDCEPDPQLPRLGSTSRQVATYIYEMACIMGYEYSSADVIGFCQEQGYAASGKFDIAMVFKDLIRLEVAASRTVLGPIPDSVWGWAAFNDIERPGYVVRCPSQRWLINRVTGEITSYFDKCRSALCPRCVKKRAEADLRWACEVSWGLDRIWMAVVPYDEATVDRVKKRRSRAGKETVLGRGGGMVFTFQHPEDEVGLFWLRRIDTDMVYFYASEELTGTHEPTEWVPMSRMEALRHLATQALALPGPKQRRFTGSWAQSTAEQSEPVSFDLGRNHPDDLMAMAEMAAEHELKVQHGLRLDELSKLEIEEQWKPLMKEKIKEQWAKRKASPRLHGK
jgi:hypothetical protein